MDNEARIINIIAKTFNIDRTAVDENASMDNVPEWDSLNHLRLIMSIEEEFGISLDPEDIVRFQDFQSALTIINKYISELDNNGE